MEEREWAFFIFLLQVPSLLLLLPLHFSSIFQALAVPSLKVKWSTKIGKLIVEIKSCKVIDSRVILICS